MARLTKKGALTVTRDLDRIASLLENEWEALGISHKYAQAFAYNCDVAADRIERQAGIDRKADFDPSQIGIEKAGPLEGDADESFMKGEFTQQENRELRERVQGGDTGPTKTVDAPQAPQAGKQASDLLDASDALSANLPKLAAHEALSGHVQVAAVGLAALRSAFLAGKVKAAAVDTALMAAGELIPHVASLAEGKTAASTDRLEKLAGMVASIVRRAGEVPEAFKDNQFKPKDDKGEDKKDEKDDEGKADKKASHGYDLFN